MDSDKTEAYTLRSSSCTPTNTKIDLIIISDIFDGIMCVILRLNQACFLSLMTYPPVNSFT